MHSRSVQVKDLASFCMKAMMAEGMRKEDAKITADVLVTTDTWGIFTHGTRQLRALMQNFKCNKMKVDAISNIVSEGPSWAIIDGKHSMPMVSSVKAMELAIDKAKKTSIVIITIRNSGHYGAAGYYANLAAKEDMIGLSFSNVDANVAAPGSRVPVLGTNPLAYAVPAGKEYPVMLDIALSTVSASKVYAAKDLKKSVPLGWIIDRDGLPTTDPSGFPASGALLPMAGYKGYGIAVLVEILTGVLSGGAFGSDLVSWIHDQTLPVNQSHSFIVINIGMFMPVDIFKAKMDKLISEIKNAPRAKNTERIYLPGEMEWEKREIALREGINLPEYVISKLKELADDYNMNIKYLFK